MRKLGYIVLAIMVAVVAVASSGCVGGPMLCC